MPALAPSAGMARSMIAAPTLSGSSAAESAAVSSCNCVPGALFTPRAFGVSLRGDVPRHDGQPRLSGEDVDIQPDVVAGRVEDVVLGVQGETFGHRPAQMLFEGCRGWRGPGVPER